MYNIEETKHLFNQTLTLLTLTNEIYSEEDDYLELWMALGIPDGATPVEILECLEDDPNQFKEWYHLAMKIILKREVER